MPTIFRGPLRGLPERPYRPEQAWWGQQNLLLTTLALDRSKIFRGPLRGLPEQPPPPNAFQSWTWSYNKNLIGRDKLPPGARVTETPRDYQRAQDLRTWTQSANPALITKRSPFAQVDWPVPIAAAQPALWTQPYNVTLYTIDNFQRRKAFRSLPPQPPLSHFQTWIQTRSLALTARPFAQLDWPIPPRGVEPDYRRSWESSFNKNLTGQDQLPIRQQDWPVTQAFPSLARTWIQQTNVLLIGMAQPFGPFDWPNATVPTRDVTLRTWASGYNQNLIGADRLPIRQQDWAVPPRIVEEVRTWIDQVKRVLIQSVPFNQTDWRPPRPSFRDPTLVDFTASYNLNLIGQDQLPFRQQDWPLTPAAARGAELSTWIDRTKFVLAGLAEPFNQTDWRNPTPPFRDPTLVGFTASYNLNLIGADQLPNRQQDWPLSSAHALNQIPLQIMVAAKGFWLFPMQPLPVGVRFGGMFTERPQLRTGVPADFYTIAVRAQIVQPTMPAVTAVFAKPFAAGPGYLTAIPGNPPS
jgi:hypothetical protein